MSARKIIAVVGQTASGKTSLGILLAKKLNGEVISADSRQVYKGLDIGTGKVTKKEMAGVPHHLLDVVSPKNVFTANDFVRLGSRAIGTIYETGHVPIIVGGTGFYIDALLGRITLAKVPPNPKLRAKLKKKSSEQLFAILKKLDLKRANRIDPKNHVRLIRAIEVALGGPAADPVAEPVDVRGSAAGPWHTKPRILFIGLNPNKAKLQKNIHLRLLQRMKAGMVGEATRLHKQGLSYRRMDALGLEYRYLANYLQNKVTKDEMLQELERAIQQYAKRQMTWFRRNKDIRWVQNKSEAVRLSKKFLSS